ncbi:MAG: hypothetical protein KAW17_11110 [Candidatus Eisenbacteria sp.]|nr:hypothetical protein [Candidatus Eisenbacteria bacterium]
MITGGCSKSALRKGLAHPLGKRALGRDFEITSRISLAGVFAATILSLSLQVLFFPKDPPLNGDESHYVMNAYHIAHGQFAQVDGFWSLFYSALSAIPVMLGAQPDTACRLVNTIAVVALVPATAWIAASAFGAAAALFAAWMVATCSLVAGLGPSCFSEPAAVLMAALALGLALPRQLQSGNARVTARYVAAGALAIVSALGRIEMAPLIVVVVACALSAPGPRPRWAVFATVIGAGVTAILLGLVLQAGGWTGAYMGKAGNFMLVSQELLDPSSEKELAHYGLTEDGEAAWEARERIEGRSFYLTPQMAVPVARRFIQRWPDVVAKLVKGCASPLPLLLVLIGLLLAKRRDGFRIAPWGIAVTAALPLVGAACVAPHSRYIMEAVPFVMVLAAGGVANGILWRPEERATGQESAKGRSGHTRALLVWTTLLVLLPAPFAVYRPLRRLAELPTVYREAGLWMRDNLPPGRMLCQPGCAVSYYAGIPEYTFFPASDLGSTVAYARRKGIRYLVLDGRLSLETRPGVGELMRGDEELANRLALRWVHDNEANGPDRVVIYEVTGSVPDSQAEGR